jgi:predicted CXXCH cytochrome family protein
MRIKWRRLPFLLAGVLLLAAGAFGGGIVVTDRLEERNTFCTSCHLHEQKFTEFHPVQGQRITLAAAHNLEGSKNVKCIDCHIGATVSDKLIIKALAARDTMAYLVDAFEEPKHLRYTLGDRTCLKCHPTGGQNPDQEKAFHNAPHHSKMPLGCSECHTVHPTATAATRFLREQTVKPLCDGCHKEIEQ